MLRSNESCDWNINNDVSKFYTVIPYESNHMIIIERLFHISG